MSNLKLIIAKYLPHCVKKYIFGYFTKHADWYGIFDLTSFLAWEITIGKYTDFAEWDARIMTVKGTKIQIGKYCSFAKWLRIVNTNHPTTYLSTSSIPLIWHHEEMLPSKDIIIGNDVWCGFNVTIMKWVTIGDGAIIGAGSIVTKNVEPYAIVAGNPAKFIRYRFPSENLRKQLLDLQWWNWDDEKIRRNQTLFTTNLSDLNEIPQALFSTPNL